MRKIAIAAAVLAAVATAAFAYEYPMVPFVSGHGPMVNGGIPGPGVPNVFDLTPPPPNPCTGAADFSDGCAVAVFGH